MIERIFAGVVLAMCVVLLVRLALGTSRRARFDRWARSAAWGLRARAVALWRWPRSRRQAQQLADDAIRRAREGHWDGNVYTPERFNKKPPRDEMH